MKHLFLILALCLPSFGSMTLVQSVLGGSGSSSGTIPFTVTSSAVGYSSPTTTGNFLVCVAWATQVGSGGAGHQVESINLLPPSGGALTWATPVTGSRGWINSNSNPTRSGVASIFYIVNAPSTSATFTVTAQAPGTGQTFTMTVEFSLYEFSGVQQSDGAGAAAVIDAQGGFEKDSVTGGVLLGGTITPTQSDLIISSYSGDSTTGGNVTAGSGYTLGVDATVATLGQTQYKLSSGTGSQSSLFASNPATFFGGPALAFKPISASASGVARHKGYVF